MDTLRDKQIEEASVEFQMSNMPMAIGGDAFGDLIYKANINPTFIAGAKWSDEHPRNGLIELNKAYIWLSDFLVEHYIENHSIGEEVNYTEVLNNFRKAMEGV